MDVMYNIPADLTKGKQKVTVKFQALSLPKTSSGQQAAARPA